MLIFPNALFGRTAADEAPPAALELDFAAGIYRAAGASYASLAAMPGYSFARSGEQGATNGDAPVGWFAAGVPAINGLGFHAYGATTNKAMRSQELEQWVTDGVSIAANAQAAPDGTMTADTFTATAGAYHISYIGLVDWEAGVHSDSIYLKAGSGRFAQLFFANALNQYAYANFDLVDGKVTAAGPGSQGYIVPAGGGWLRCVLIAELAAGNNNAFSINMIATGTATRLAGPAAAGETIHAWQAQALTGSFADGGPLVRTAAAPASIGASALTVGLADGEYSAAFTFDDHSTQTMPVTVSGGTFRHPVRGALNRGIVRRTVVTAA